MAKVIAKVELHSDHTNGRTYLVESLVPKGEDLPTAGTFSVTRTRSDFVALHHAYEYSHPWAILPEVPAEVGITIRRFMGRLESFLRLLLVHPEIGRDPVLFDFLTKSEWSAPVTQPNNPLSLGSLLASSKSQSKAVADPKFAQERQKIDTALTALRNASAVIDSIAQNHEDIAFSVVEAGTILQRIGIADSAFWGDVMKAQGAHAIALGESLQAETTELSTLIKEPTEGLIAILNRGQIVLDHRDQQHQRQQTLASEVERLKEEIQSLQTKISSNTGAKTATSKWFAAALKPEEKEAKLQSQLTEAQAATEKSRQEYEEVARKLAAEIKYVEHVTTEDFSKLLIESAVRQRAFSEEQLARWEDIASSLAQGLTVGDGRLSSVPSLVDH